MPWDGQFRGLKPLYAHPGVRGGDLFRVFKPSMLTLMLTPGVRGVHPGTHSYTAPCLTDAVYVMHMRALKRGKSGWPIS